MVIFRCSHSAVLSPVHTAPEGDGGRGLQSGAPGSSHADLAGHTCLGAPGSCWGSGQELDCPTAHSSGRRLHRPTSRGHSSADLTEALGAGEESPAQHEGALPALRALHQPLRSRHVLEGEHEE